MKSLALNLFPKILPLLMLLVLLLVAAAAVEGASSASAPTSSSSSRSSNFTRNRSRLLRTTTPVPPSLPKPPVSRRRLSTTTSSSASTTPAAVSTKSPVPLMAQRQRRLPLTRQHAASSAATIMASTTSSKPVLISEATTLASTRLVRHVDATTPQANSNDQSKSVRQHRSFQSNGGGGQSYEDVETLRHQNKAIQPQRHQERTSATTEGTTVALPRNQRLRTTTKYNTNNTPSSSASLVDGRHSAGTSVDGLKTTSPPQTGNSANIKLTTRHNQQTPKTPRMIQRLVAGHIQNTDGRTSAANNNSRISYGLPLNDDSSAHGTRNSPLLSSTYRHNKLNANIRIDARTTSTTNTPKTNELNSSHNHESDYHDDDEALLDDSGDFDNWDNGILRLSAGSGKENTLKPKKGKDESKKTLADQVKDGKYGLIEKELFRRPPKRPGVLSYLPNKEVPEDNERNYGGLNEEDIWLAEDHLLVIKGGSLNEDNAAEPWPAIDDYNAAGRQIKIPDNPKVPPPFPVQLEENGPVQLIGNNKLTVVYPVPNESLSVYTAGSEAHNSSPESEGDDEKNLITRPGKTKNAKEKQPGYNYASPSLPWLSNNQTSGDPSSLNNGKPINFPVLGPFLYGRNGSLDNDTEDFDEDDPSLYYPPPYTFVYKSNYTNAVPPGPLVPGIVVPPPPDHFSKLERSEKERRPSGVSTPTRYRVYSTTSTTPPPVVTTTTTSTTTTSTTTESPYRHSVTKISEYTPKVIHIVTPSPRPIYTPQASPAISSRLQPTPPPTPPPQQHIEPVPVPVAVPIPIYSANVEPNIRPGTISFVPTTPQSHIETFSKSNPIYYEYFEAKRQQGTSHVYDDFLSSTATPYATPSPKPVKLYATSKRPYKNSQHHRNYLQPLAHNHRYVDDSVVVITPKPEVRHKQRPLYKQRPSQNFEQDVNSIRDSLRYYQNQELRDNNIPRTPKAKPVFDYSYDAGVKSVTPEGVRNTFQPPLDFDVEPFQPMVTYSPAVGDDDAFKAVGVDKVDGAALQVQGREDLDDQNLQQPKYVSTTTLVPVQQTERPKKLRVGAKYLQQPQHQHQQQQYQRQQHQHQQYQHQQQQQQQYQYQQQQQQQHQQQQHQQNQDYNRWVAVNKQEYGVYAPPETPPPPRERYQEPLAPQQPQRNRDYPGYYYGPSRQNNRFYEEPFQNAPNRKIINYRPPPPPPPAPVVQQQQQLPQQPLWSLENDTYVNYAPNRPPLNPDAEFINPYQTVPVNTYQQQQQHQQQQQRLTYQQQQQQEGPQPALSHQSQYYAPPPQLPPQRLPGRQYQAQPQAPVSLHRDILVNYRQPLPPINPDSEYISHPQVVRNPGANQYYRSNPTYRLPQQPVVPVQNLNIGGEADVYFLTPKYRRANNLSNNPGNRNHPQHGNNGK